MPHSPTPADVPSPANPAAPDPVQALRTATASLHQQLDQGLPLAQPDADLADYALHLAVLGDWQSALAPWLTRATDAPLPLDLIALDLQDCAPELRPAALPALDTTPAQAADDGSDAFCRGMAYVLEGSRLGGQVLHRQLRDRLAPHPLRYLRDRASDAGGGRPWPHTLASLRVHLADAPSQASACRGAVVAFEMLLARFRQAGSLA